MEEHAVTLTSEKPVAIMMAIAQAVNLDHKVHASIRCAESFNPVIPMTLFTKFLARQGDRKKCAIAHLEMNSFTLNCHPSQSIGTAPRLLLIFHILTSRLAYILSIKT